LITPDHTGPVPDCSHLLRWCFWCAEIFSSRVAGSSHFAESQFTESQIANCWKST